MPFLYPAWAYLLPIFILRIPMSLMESTIWIVLTYYTIGFAPAASRFFKQFLAFFAINQSGLALFRLIAAAGRRKVAANTFGFLVLFLFCILGGFIISKDDIVSWLRWAYYTSPLMYGQNAICINEFLDNRWNTATGNPSEPTVGISLLKERDLFTTEGWYWLSIGFLFGFTIVLNIISVFAMTYLNAPGDKNPSMNDSEEEKNQSTSNSQGMEMVSTRGHNSSDDHIIKNPSMKGMVLPFQPLSLSFNDINYYVDMPAEMKAQGFEEDRLQLLRNVCGAFRPGNLTALLVTFMAAEFSFDASHILSIF